MADRFVYGCGARSLPASSCPCCCGQAGLARCHTAPGGQPFAGGLYMPTPLGDISTPNITPDKTTGIGNWTDDQFY